MNGLKLLGSKYGLAEEVGGVGDHGITPEGGAEKYGSWRGRRLIAGDSCKKLKALHQKPSDCSHLGRGSIVHGLHAERHVLLGFGHA